jgi:hypothetical protein
MDAEFTVGQRFGARGTPMGILLDAEGKISASLGAGRDGVLDLARRLAPADAR